MFGAETMKFFIKPLDLFLVLDWDNRKRNSTINNFQYLTLWSEKARLVLFIFLMSKLFL